MVDENVLYDYQEQESRKSGWISCKILLHILLINS